MEGVKTQSNNTLAAVIPLQSKRGVNIQSAVDMDVQNQDSPMDAFLFVLVLAAPCRKRRGRAQTMNLSYESQTQTLAHRTLYFLSSTSSVNKRRSDGKRPRVDNWLPLWLVGCCCPNTTKISLSVSAGPYCTATFDGTSRPESLQQQN